MKRLALGVALLLGVILAYSARPAPQQPAARSLKNRRSFRIVFGQRQDAVRDYSGSLSLSQGSVAGITGWRFHSGDAIQGNAAWKLQIRRGAFESQPDRPRSLADGGAFQNVIPAGLNVTVEAPDGALARIKTASGDFEFALRDVRPGAGLLFLGGDVTVEPAATVERVSPAESSEQQDYPSMAVSKRGVVWLAWLGYQAGGEHLYARHTTSSGWSQVFRLTDRRGDLFGTAVAEDAKGRTWVVWSERSDAEWHLYGRSYDGRNWSPRTALTSGTSPNFSQRLTGDGNGRLHLVWVGHQNGESHVFHRALEGDAWSPPVEVSGPGAWSPDAAADSHGNLYIVWDSYRTGNYDIFLRKMAPGGSLEPVQQVTRSPAFQAHASIAVDSRDRAWIAWDESGANWGKDWSHEDAWRSTPLYANRSIRVAVLDRGRWMQPADLRPAVPDRFLRYWQWPRLAAGADGRVWIMVQCRTSTANTRADFWANNGRWEYYYTDYEGDHWSPLVPIPESSTRDEGVTAAAAAPDGLWLAWTTDNRAFGAPGGLALPSVMKYEIFASAVHSGPPPGPPRLDAFSEPAMAASPVHPNEGADVARIRSYRSGDLRIVRGDFHRHTEISPDGAGDGSVEEYFRYMIDVAEMDTGIISDHNAGNSEYTWWRTEKAIDLFHIPGRLTPLFGYERSVPFPNGHRNLVFAQRGVPVLPIGAAENKGAVNSGPILYPYLRQHRGIAMEHSLATGQGTDWRDNDREVEPLVEIYQGYHAAYEYEGGPRAETANFLVRIHGSYEPSGFYWNALKKGYKLGVQSSSDHISTHSSYTMIYSPTTERRDIVESMRRRHAYGATDNIILDFRTDDGHRMGDAFATNGPPRFQVKVEGTDRIETIEIIRNGEFVFTTRPDSKTAEFAYVDNNAPRGGENWYYVRVTQIDRNLAWSSPMWVRMQ